MHNVIIVGGGMAGLAAARHLNRLDVLLLEADSRVGGRVYSEGRGHYWLNFGAHVFGDHTPTARLLDELSIRTLPLEGRLTAMMMKGKLLKTGRVETYPLRIPMSVKDRLDAIRVGLKVMANARRYSRFAKTVQTEDYLLRQFKLMPFMGNETFENFMGNISETAAGFFVPTSLRMAADPNELSAGTGVGMFARVWEKGGDSRSLYGGTEILPNKLASRLSADLRLGAKVLEVVNGPDHVRVVYEHEGQVKEALAEHCIVATPTHITADIWKNAPADLVDALRRIKYGPCVVVSYLTKETTPQPWDDCYAIATPGQPFNAMFNIASTRRYQDLERQPGGSLMVYAMAGLGRKLLDTDPEAIKSLFMDGLSKLFPHFPTIVQEAVVKKWHHQGPHIFPGRDKLQPILTRPYGRVQLAGDYFGWTSVDTAVYTADLASQKLLSQYC